MPTVNRDFIVKNGLQVQGNSGITFPDGSTKTTAGVPYGPTLPISPIVGTLFFNTSTGKLYIYFDNWIELAYATNPESNLFINGGSPSSTVFARFFDGGLPSSDFDTFIDGGQA